MDRCLFLALGVLLPISIPDSTRQRCEAKKASKILRSIAPNFVFHPCVVDRFPVGRGDGYVPCFPGVSSTSPSGGETLANFSNLRFWGQQGRQASASQPNCPPTSRFEVLGSQLTPRGRA